MTSSLQTTIGWTSFFSAAVIALIIMWTCFLPDTRARKKYSAKGDLTPPRASYHTAYNKHTTSDSPWQRSFLPYTSHLIGFILPKAPSPVALRPTASPEHAKFSYRKPIGKSHNHKR
jgi:hypothetical protein